MLEMLWNDELARVAEAKGRRCANRMGQIRNPTDPLYGTNDFPDIGLNVYTQWDNTETTPIILRVVIRNWFDQNIDLPRKELVKYKDALNTQDFVQLVAADTYALGCSYKLHAEHAAPAQSLPLPLLLRAEGALDRKAHLPVGAILLAVSGRHDV
ncbi:hypothetical protein MRX96_052954 [Rhipicephalus microplus]|uniref:Uncharacterized protein n=1 Tax=Rhipicephalus microplus TaxID=6941 RepID=A0A9J6CUG4_RHIMP|nr:hypothetical protein HPB51_029295 [Rhipicephalus microplus]